MTPDTTSQMKASRFSDSWAASFRASPFRLRFELGGEVFGSEAPVPRFVQAFGRARQIAYDALLGSKQVFAVVGCWPDTEHDLFAPASDAFEALKILGFAAASTERWSGIHPLWNDEDDEDSPQAHWQSFDITEEMSDRDVIIWCATTYEAAIYPKAPVMPFLVDVKRGILIHIYDDRGMDIISLDRETLTNVYRMHDQWLLDHDRQRIIEVFGSIK